MSLRELNLPEYGSPIKVRTDGDGEIVRVLLHEEWYDRLKPLYDWAEAGGAVIEVKTPLSLDVVTDFLEELVVEIGYGGWLVEVSFAVALIYLAKRGVALGKFTYEVLGFGEGRFGEGSYGDGGPVVREFPVEG